MPKQIRDARITRRSGVLEQHNGLVFRGTVTTYTDTTHFKVSSLPEYGNADDFPDEFFKDYYVYVAWDAGGAGAAPQGESQKASAYTSSDGSITHPAFTTPLAVGDEILLIHKIVTEALPSAETTGSYNLPNDTAENTAIEITTTDRRRLDSVWLDFVNLVQDVTIKVYHKIDGSTYRQYDEFSWGTAEEDGILINDITINNDWKLTVTSTVAQGGIMAIPYNIIYSPMEA